MQVGIYSAYRPRGMDMRRIMILGIALAVSGGIGTAACAANATAPAFFECVKAPGGKFKAGCKVQSTKGSAELVEGAGHGKAFKGTGTTLSPFAPAINGGELECSGKTTLVGSLATPKSFKGLQITQKGCIGGTVRSCQSAGQKTGTIVSAPLEGRLAYIDAGASRVGLDLSAEGGGDMWSYECDGFVETIAGSLIGEITPVNSLTKTYTVTFTRDSEGFQSVKRVEGEPEDVPLVSVNGSGPFSGSISGSITYKGENLDLKG